MAFPALPSTLPGLTDREAIADALYRAVLAFDHGDDALLSSAITDDVTAEMPGSPPSSGIAALKAAVFDRVAYEIDTTHFLSNIRVSVETGASTAQVSCSALAQHVRKGKGFEPGPHRFTSGGMYLCDVVKDEPSGLWKIKTWKANIVWVDGNPAVMTGW
ncbi:hypothetical protein GQX73_g1427 [Xylaria multiplex]|uniref:SnoaL-like domain-containing protein n=1 Tax=Xylaria multiplex TaxID=323545 RepID=A0A7C8IWW6_9PEZI|nr:hypothetical protein GQX73_g1427 [Xylaria multiplex]